MRRPDSPRPSPPLPVPCRVPNRPRRPHRPRPAPLNLEASSRRGDRSRASQPAPTVPADVTGVDDLLGFGAAPEPSPATMRPNGSPRAGSETTARRRRAARRRAARRGAASPRDPTAPAATSRAPMPRRPAPRPAAPHPSPSPARARAPRHPPLAAVAPAAAWSASWR